MSVNWTNFQANIHLCGYLSQMWNLSMLSASAITHLSPVLTNCYGDILRLLLMTLDVWKILLILLMLVLSLAIGHHISKHQLPLLYLNSTKSHTTLLNLSDPLFSSTQSANSLRKSLVKDFNFIWSQTISFTWVNWVDPNNIWWLMLKLLLCTLFTQDRLKTSIEAPLLLTLPNFSYPLTTNYFLIFSTR